MRRRPCLAVAACLLAAGCGTPLLPQASGPQAQDRRDVGPFTAIENSTSADLTVSVGGSGPVEVSGAADVLPKIVTRVEGDKLVIETDGSFSTTVPLRVTAPTATLTGLSERGSGDATVSGATGTLRVEALGSGDVTATGAVDTLAATVSGSGDLALAGLTAQTAQVTASGSGDVDVTVVRSLDAVVTGSGDVVYGSGGPAAPAVTTRKQGSGDVRGR